MSNSNKTPVYTSITIDDAQSYLNNYILNVRSEKSGEGSFRNFMVKADLHDLVLQTNELYTALLFDKIHWINIEVLPLKMTSKIYFETKVHDIDNASLSLVPALAPSHTIEDRVTTNKSKSKRYGAGVFLEGDFASMEQGVQSILRSLEQFASMGRERLAMEAYETLLKGNVKNPLQTAILRNASDQVNRQFLFDEAEATFICNKYRVGVNLAIRKHANEMELQTRVRPNIAIAPNGKIDEICTIGNRTYNDYSIAGPDGPKRLMQDVEITNVNGVSIRRAPFTRDQDNVVSEIRTHIYIGQYFDFGPRIDQNLTNQSFGIYDVVQDSRVFYKFEDFIANHPWFIKNLVGRYRFDAGIYTGNLNQAFKDKIAIAASSGVYLEVDVWKTIIKFYGFRPMEGNYTQDILLVAGGPKLGFTAHSENSIDTGRDVGIRSMSMEFRGWIGAHVEDWRRVKVIRHAFYAGTGNGGNSKLINKKTADDYKTKKFALETVNDPSIYLIVGLIDDKLKDNVIDITGHPDYSSDKQSVDGDYPNWKAHSMLYGFDKLDSSAAKNMPITRTLFRGSLVYYTANNVLFEEIGNGHHGPREEQGCAYVRRHGNTCIPHPL